jgi:site-specific DNA-methyltransferase (adenine-specific)
VIHHGDCLEVMAGMEPESVDAIVTDPPYDLTSTGARKGSPRSNAGTGPYARLDRGGFMGKRWDGTGVAFRPETWEAAYRVAKPSAYLLAFGGTRTVHRLTTAIEDAGWIIRDMLVWAYASGFPKSKASLKPAWEPIVMARKPGPLRMLAIDECRIGPPLTDAEIARTGGVMGESDGRGIYGPGKRRPAGGTRQGEPSADRRYTANGGTDLAALPGPRGGDAAGRWPANVILTDPIFDGGVEGVVGGGASESGIAVERNGGGGKIFGSERRMPPREDFGYGDSGTYSRFFLIPKADRGDREPIMPRTGEHRHMSDATTGGTVLGTRANHHPTVKPVDLMRHLVRLVTPPGGTVLDPFLGSGTTGLACELEGFPWIGIEREAEYVAIAEARLNGTQRGMGLVG